jgi:hypothetical protein
VWPACVSATLRTTDLPSVRACATGSGSSTVHHSSPRVRQQHRLDWQVLDPRAGERKITTSTRQDPALKALVLDVLKVLSPAPDNRRARVRRSLCSRPRRRALPRPREATAGRPTSHRTVMHSR